MSEPLLPSGPELDEQLTPMEKMALRIDDRMRASGRTVTVTESSESTEFVASFLCGRPPAVLSHDGSSST